MKKTSMILTAVLAALTITTSAMAGGIEAPFYEDDSASPCGDAGPASPYGDAGPASPDGDAGKAFPEEAERAEPVRFSGPVIPIESLRLTSCEFSCGSDINSIEFLVCVGACMAKEAVENATRSYLDTRKGEESSYGSCHSDSFDDVPTPPDEEDSGEKDDEEKP